MADTTMFFQLVSQRFSFPHKKNAAVGTCGSDKRRLL